MLSELVLLQDAYRCYGTEMDVLVLQNQLLQKTTRNRG